MNSKLTAIKEWLSKNDYKYKNIPDESINNIYDLLINEKFNEPKNDIEMVYYAHYYDINNEHNNMMKYYLMAIDCGNNDAMNNLAIYYQNIKDYDNMMKYFLMAIENNNVIAMNNLACYYKKNQDYDNMLKYYLMAIDKNYSTAMYNLGVYYQNIKDYDNMKKYYLMAIDKGNSDAMNNLGVYYYTNKDYDNMMKYYLMAINNGYQLTIEKLKIIIKINQLDTKYIQIMEELDYDTYFKIFEKNDMALLAYKLYKSKIDLIELPFKYSPDNDGFIEAKNDYIKQIQNIEKPNT